MCTLLAALYLEEDYRGNAAWQQYRMEAHAKGVKMDISDFAPSPIPDEQNFGATPSLAALEAATDPNSPAAKTFLFDEPRGFAFPRIASLSPEYDLKAWQQSFIKAGLLPSASDNPAADVLKVLEKYEPLLAELRDAATRPGTRLLYGDWRFDHFPLIRPYLSVARILSLRVIALLALGRSSDAFADWNVICRLTELLRFDPSALGTMTGLMVMSFAIESVRTGLQMDAWKAPELAKIQTALASFDPPRDLAFGLEGERARWNTISDQLSRTPRLDRYKLIWLPFNTDKTKMPRWTWSFSNVFITLLPQGWIGQNLVRWNEYCDGAAKGVGDRAFAEELDARTSRRRSSRNPYLALVNGSSLLICPEGDMAHQYEMEIGLCRIGCALEQFHQNSGDFPNQLTDLVPRWLSKLPKDNWKHETLHYDKAPSGAVTFSLESAEPKRNGRGMEDNRWAQWTLGGATADQSAK